MENNQSLAAEYMKNLFVNNIYQDCKRYEFELKEIAREIKKRHPEDSKVWEFDKVIAIIQHPNVFETDRKGLNECLYDYGILHKVTYFDITKETPQWILDKLEPFKNPIETFAKFNPKRGLVSKEKKSYDRYSDEALIELWLRTKQFHSDLENDIEQTKEAMMSDIEFRKTRKAITDFGSVSILNKKPTYDMDAVLRELGPEFIIENAKVNTTELEKYVTKGVITEKEINSYRTLTDIIERYVILTKESFQNQGELMTHRRNAQAQNLADLWSYKK